MDHRVATAAGDYLLLQIVATLLLIFYILIYS